MIIKMIFHIHIADPDQRVVPTTCKRAHDLVNIHSNAELTKWNDRQTGPSQQPLKDENDAWRRRPEQGCGGYQSVGSLVDQTPVE
ncbi:hypothetical protein Hdeb2414_s0023g00625461 [Helianthus debilis subsp. tardiflorus]